MRHILFALAMSLTMGVSAADFKAPKSLDLHKPAEVAKVFKKKMGKDLKACLARWEKKNHQDGNGVITQEIAAEFRDNWYAYNPYPSMKPCYNSYDLKETITSIFTSKRHKSVKVKTMVRWFEEKANQELSKFVDGEGYIKRGSKYGLLYYGAIINASDIRAKANFKEPAGISYDFLRDTWKKVGLDNNLDMGFYNPVQLDPKVVESDQLFSHLRKAFGLGSVSYDSAGFAAVENFWNSSEGPEGDKAFAPLAKAFGSKSIKKRFYFVGGSEHPFPWSRNILILVDQHDQAWGYYMGYSE